MHAPDAGIIIRQARIEDADGIARAHMASWRVTYRGIIRDETLDALRLEERAEMWRERLHTLTGEPPPRREACYVAVDAGGRGGWFRARRARAATDERRRRRIPMMASSTRSIWRQEQSGAALARA